MTDAAYHIEGGDYEHGGAASRSLKDQLKKVGADPAVVRRAMVAAYEAEMNVVIHAHRGELLTRLQDDRLDVDVIDDGPGIPSIEQAMRPGFSTAPAAARELGFGAGMGLPNIKKNSDRFEIESTVGKGTRVSFSVLLKPQALYGVGRHSLRIEAERCRQSLRCLHVCPTRAIRVFRGKPEVLDYLCVDCAACIGVCPSGTLGMAGTGTDDGAAFARLAARSDAVLVIPPAALVQYGAGVPVERVLEELGKLWAGEVCLTDGAEAALRSAVAEYAVSESPVRPVLSPACPAVVNLVETKFPSLIPHLAPFRSAIESVRAEVGPRAAAFVVSCPCQRTALLAGGTSAGSTIAAFSPHALRGALQPRLQREAIAAGRERYRATAEASDGVMRVTGVKHVLAILEAIENRLAEDLDAVEPWMCDERCYGSPLWSEEPFLARQRWEAVNRSGLGTKKLGALTALRRTEPFSARPGLRLDQDMAKAIAKLAKIDRLARSLPGSDCGMCGAPTCGALAEDIVLGRASADACVRQCRAAVPPGNQEQSRNQEKSP